MGISVQFYSVLMALCAAAVPACSKENTVTVNNGNSDAGADAPLLEMPDCSGGVAPGTAGRGPSLVRIPTGPGGTCIWVDESEVTQAQYAAFLADPTASPGSFDTQCAWNTSFTDPACETDSPLAKAGKIKTGDAYPVVCVDWCDAQEFCRWAGKELCRGDAIQTEDPLQSSWYAACSNGGTTTLAYGSQQDDNACNGASNKTGDCPDGACSAVEVKSMASCATLSSSFIYDLDGNVEEWVNECKSAGQSGLCNTRGGSFLSDNISCGATTGTARVQTSGAVGFRCCAYDE